VYRGRYKDIMRSCRWIWLWNKTILFLKWCNQCKGLFPCNIVSTRTGCRKTGAEGV